jgi:hypothetical protein
MHTVDLAFLACPALQIWAFMLLAVVGGWLASVFTAFNTWICLVRKKWSKVFSFRILEVCAQPALSAVTRILHHERDSGPLWRAAGLLSPLSWWLSASSIMRYAVQVCLISVITSVVLFALPLGGCCHACDSGNTEHCVKSELQGRVQSASLQEVPAMCYSGLHHLVWFVGLVCCDGPPARSCVVSGPAQRAS